MPNMLGNNNVTSNTLFQLADQTGGFVTRNTEDPDEALAKIVAEQNEHYVLGYAPPDSEEGSCHNLKVKLNKGGGLKVRARTEYCKLKSKNMLSGKPIEKTLEAKAADSKAGTVTAAMQVPFFYTSPNVARVNLAMDLAMDTLKVDKQKNKMIGAIDVLGIAYRPDESIAARFSDTVKFEFADKKEADAFKQRKSHYENEFEIASGDYTLKVVFSSGGENFGKLEMPLKIEPYNPTELRVSSLALSREARAAAAVLGLDTGLDGGTPLVSQGVQVIPTGSSRFRANEQPLYYFEIYEPRVLAPPDPQNPFGLGIRVRILDRKSGEQKADSGLMRVDNPNLEGKPVIPVANRLPVNGLGAGAYVLELEALDSAGASFKRRADFELE